MAIKYKSGRFFTCAGILCWIISLNLYIYFYHYDKFDSVINNKHYQNGLEDYGAVNSFENENKISHRIDDYIPLNTSILKSDPVLLYQSEYLEDNRNVRPSFSSNYQNIYNNHPDLKSVMGQLDFNQRCNLYFQNLYSFDHNWAINPNERLPLIDKNDFDYTKWRASKTKDLKEAFKEKYSIENENDIKYRDLDRFIRSQYDKFWNQTLKVEQKASDMLSHLRIFNKCYIYGDDVKVKSDTKKLFNKQIQYVKSLRTINKGQESRFRYTKDEIAVKINPLEECSDLEHRLYPWLSFHFPIFEKWTGDIQMSPPRFTKSKPINEKGCFLNKFKNSLNGKGIVLTVGTKHVDDTVNLIKLLRAHLNTYPIQIVYYDNLSAASKRKIVQAARENVKDFPSSFQKVKHLLPQKYDYGLPQQDIWFVNVFNVVQEQYRDKFLGFGNKLLATVFNSFEEFILLDADSVILKPPTWFFENNKYKSGGALFYKDRTTPEFRPNSDSYFFRKMTPSVLDSIFFDFPMITSKTLELEAMTGMYHFMESGVVVLNKAKHFDKLLLLPQLNFMDLFKGRSHGEKELFWLVFIINGNEQFEFNKYNAAAAGQLQKPVIKKNGKERLAQEICSAHPAHVDDETNELIWFNSGFHLCGQHNKVKYEDDLKNQDNRYDPPLDTEKDLKTFYYEPLRLKHVIIPPFKNKEETFCDNKEDEPTRAWFMVHNLCNSYLWCGVSQIGYGDNLQKGTIIELDSETRKLYDYLGDTWVGIE
ncbi:mannosyltransferase putative-domain-containing protein [Scheffersomyces amazonensis]|uniref:mannosyltransferase putative-domain-containing protein n=1 Tax=Scheffersomyces amazonensis TaxID=1078765 RepID=UPI00315C882E